MTDRITVLPASQKEPLRDQLRRVRQIHARDVKEGRHHMDESLLQKAVREAVIRARHQAGNKSHISAFVCDAPAGERIGYPHGPRTPGSSRAENNHDLHPRSKPRAGGGPDGRTAEQAAEIPVRG